jgi:hypothetical protein
MFIRNLALIAIVAAVPAVLAAILYDVTTIRGIRPAESRDHAPSFHEAPAVEATPVVARYRIGSNQRGELLYR